MKQSKNNQQNNENTGFPGVPCGPVDPCVGTTAEAGSAHVKALAQVSLPPRRKPNKLVLSRADTQHGTIAKQAHQGQIIFCRKLFVFETVFLYGNSLLSTTYVCP